jgi:ribose-phosphate pyrophosphokinase
VAHVVGDVKGKTAIIIDDMVDTGGSICAAADVVKKYGAKEVIICATHALLNGKAIENLENCCASEVIFLDTIPISEENKINKMKIISLAPLLSKVIDRIHKEKSLGELFKWEEQSKLL